MTARNCRFCGAPLAVTFCDLGLSPLSNAFVKPVDAKRDEAFYPLHAYVCERCLLVQLEEFETPQQIFSDYAYFSSYSDTWLEHARSYAERMIAQMRFGPEHLVIEIASNDGYLLQYFKQAAVPVLGIEPAHNVAAAAIAKGIPTISEFFGAALAARLVTEGRRADLLIGNNVFAHIPDLNDFTSGLAAALAPQGVLTLEFPHLLNLIRENQFDTIYHEHFSYFSFLAARRVLEQHGLSVFDVERIPTHGGSLRVHAGHAAAGRTSTARVAALAGEERAAGLESIDTYRAFAKQVKSTKRKILDFLAQIKDEGKTIVGYGAPAKANTLLNYCGIHSDCVEFTVDRSPHKQGLLLPGTHIPVYHPDKIFERRPDCVLILPWNLKDEIMRQMAAVRDWGGQFIVLIPEPAVC